MLAAALTACSTTPATTQTNPLTLTSAAGSSGARAPEETQPPPSAGSHAPPLQTGGTTATIPPPPQAGASAASASTGTAGQAGASGSAAGSGSCGTSTRNLTPFGCNFAWGTNDPGGSLAAFAGLQFMSKWVGYEIDKDGNLPSCDGCSWLTNNVAATSLIPVYYAYFIGYLGHANGLPDGNQNPNGPNLTTDAANLIRQHRDQLLSAYAAYAKQSAAVWKSKPLVWLLEGDFVQYTDDTQKNKLTMTELAELARDITCAIKSNMPNAVVAINHTTWNGDQVTNDFWDAMAQAGVDYDLV